MNTTLQERPPTPQAPPPKRAETCRMFENDFLEKFSRIHPATPFVFWIPIAAFTTVRTLMHHDATYGGAALLALGGIFTWTVTEYFLHRYVFHWTNDTSWGKRIHFLLHGVHHDFPNDKDRLVMPLLTSIPLAIIFYSLFALTLGKLAGPFFTGFTLGYLTYDGTHYAIHHFKQTSRMGRWVKRHHMLHHHMDHSGGFGVSNPLWDLVFGTMPRVKPLKKRAPNANDADTATQSSDA